MTLSRNNFVRVTDDVEGGTNPVTCVAPPTAHEELQQQEHEQQKHEQKKRHRRGVVRQKRRTRELGYDHEVEAVDDTAAVVDGLNGDADAKSGEGPLKLATWVPLRGSPDALISCPEKIKETTMLLQASCGAERRQIVTWVLPSIMRLSLGASSCRFAQEVVVAAAGEDQKKLLAAIECHVVELYKSPHGNHVLAKIIEVMPSATLGRLIGSLEGRANIMARHPFGCRIWERLLEHCSASQLDTLIMEELVPDIKALAPHPYGTFVIKHIFEHGTDVRRVDMLQRLLPLIPEFAAHRRASYVVQRALDFCDDRGQSMIIDALLASPGFLSEICNSRYGSFVVEKVASIDKVKQRLCDGCDELSASQTGRKLAERCGVTIPAPLVDEQ